MNKKITTLTSSLVLLFSQWSYGQAAIELTCKAKAKEIALQTYDTCVTEKKQAQIEQIRMEYQDKLNELKKQYDNELKKMGSAISTSTQTSNANNSGKSTKASKSSKLAGKIAKTLPAKANSKEALTMKSVGADEIIESTQGGVYMDEAAEIRLTNKSQAELPSSDEMELNY